MCIELYNKPLFQTITKVVNHLENELGELNKGIFFAPELHLVLEVGKALYTERVKVCKKKEIEWLNETGLDNGVRVI
ncbi:hypothetical protein [Cyclobacterium marinum]|uniref:hypothetical protein n=1 Tax=Cyclobacterium marinum TaxID=104 RepID=UPI0011EDEFF6|nr:hypothetical protein [Cyclobacterium marinum]MBI0399100.1 hypothetical protein [Cyclobacterium marinum]